LPKISKSIAKKGVSQDKLSKIAGVTYNMIIKIESGATSNSRMETLKQIADALDVRIDDLVKR